MMVLGILGGAALAVAIIYGAALLMRRIIKGKPLPLPLVIMEGATYLKMHDGRLRKMLDHKASPAEVAEIVRLAECARRAR